nr:hypothetical protein [Tanacetum cinerariifolium]
CGCDVSSFVHCLSSRSRSFLIVIIDPCLHLFLLITQGDYACAASMGVWCGYLKI